MVQWTGLGEYCTCVVSCNLYLTSADECSNKEHKEDCLLWLPA